MSVQKNDNDLVQRSVEAGSLAPVGPTNPQFRPPQPDLHATVPSPASPSSVNNATTHFENQVNVNMAMPSIQMNTMAKGHSLVTRVLWFCLVGWWLSAIFIFLGVFFTWTVVLMPLGFWFINRIPKAQTLRERTRQFSTEFKDSAIVFTEGKRDQFPWYIRAPYALTVGAVAGLFWLSAAWAFGVLIVTLPLSIWMIDRAPAIMTLEKN